jgi:aspartate oxidase
MPPFLLAAGVKMKGFFGTLMKSKLFYIALAVLAIAGGTYGYLRHSTNKQVEAAVTGADASATIATYQTKEEAEAALQPHVEKAEQKAEQTRKDYDNVRRQVYRAPAPVREAAAPRIIVDALNDLERLSREREAGGVPDAEVLGSRTDVQGNASRPASE